VSTTSGLCFRTSESLAFDPSTSVRVETPTTNTAQAQEQQEGSFINEGSAGEITGLGASDTRQAALTCSRSLVFGQQ
jgi:hypothetical protein